MRVNAGETDGNGIDDDANGYVDDNYGINVLTGTGDDPYELPTASPPCSQELHKQTAK